MTSRGQANPSGNPPQPVEPSAPTHTRGWQLNFAAGFVPLSAGLITLLTTWLGIADPNSYWSTGVGHLNFSFASLNAAGSQTSAWVALTGSVGGVNVVAAAVAVIVVSRFGLRSGHRWAWWFLAFCLVWIGFQDAFAATRFFVQTGMPFMMLPYTFCALMLAGLLASRSTVFSRAR